jgi:DNA-binding phage protein
LTFDFSFDILVTMTNLHIELKKVIDSKRLSAAEIARRAGCSRQYLYTIINLGQQPTLPQAEKLASAIGLTLELRKKNNGKTKSKNNPYEFL